MAIDGATINVRVAPRAGRTVVTGRRGNAWHVRLAAAPVDGVANSALIEFVAKSLDCPRRNISIISGENSRDKRLRILGFTDVELDRRMSALANQ